MHVSLFPSFDQGCPPTTAWSSALWSPPPLSALLSSFHTTPMDSLSGTAAFVAAATAAAFLLVKKHAARSTRLFASREVFTRKAQRIVADGPEHLQILLDFDRTITRYRMPGGKVAETSYGIIEGVASPACKQQLKSLFEKYHAIEFDPSLSIEEKLPHMQKWYELAHLVFMEDKITKAAIAQACRESGDILRPGVREIFDLSRSLNIPLVVFSAGMGNVIVEVLQSLYGPLPPNLHVISNWMLFSEESGAVCGFTEPLIHMFNKDERHLRNIPGLAEQLAARNNAILCGDSVGDVRMGSGLPHTGEVLRIGLVNDAGATPGLLEQYRAAFDEVLVDDPALTDIVHMLQRMQEAVQLQRRLASEEKKPEGLPLAVPVVAAMEAISAGQAASAVGGAGAAGTH